MLEYEGFEVYWDGHASVRVVDEGFTVAVDPFSEVSPYYDANLVLVTHNDAGHFDREKLEKVCSEETCLVLPESMEHVDVPCQDVEFIEEGEVLDVYGIEIEALPMENQLRETHSPGVGYRFVMRGNSFYVAGDTGVTEKAFDLEGKVDIAFMPVEGVYTMDVEDAVRMAVRIKPSITVPYHYGEPFFSDVNPDLQGMKAELMDRNLECRIMERRTR